MNSLAGQPIADIALGALELRLLGTAHVSRTSAAAVARELERGGVAPALLSVVGYGSKYPVAADEAADGRDSPEGRARNRRVEIVVFD